jgi:hypothetical protein
MILGSVILNGVNDEQLRFVLGVKIKSEEFLTFNPQQLQPVPKAANVKEQVYNNMMLAWRDHRGLRAVDEILREFAGPFSE